MKKSSIEMVVGLFMIAGFLAFAYLAFNLGEISLFSGSRTYIIKAEFDNVAGVKKGGTVQIAGVVVGEVENIALSDQYASLSLRINKDIKVPVDSMASVKSQGIIGDKYIQLTLGGEEDVLTEGDVIFDTESSVDIESLISKFAFGSAE
ncbi:MAG: outer membrane lipid asymmetry maintenance protein MlaD [Desulfopila sp.]|jgi:phospholipid/cholesterol/gamma-HCH transport system substrate-binding protein|nr:outer membrane lipid asymmetry maintenance protein MlaD [Desulfopila sp.]